MWLNYVSLIKEAISALAESMFSFSGNSFFTWCLSVGMMYMMSAGKAEMNRLNSSMDETANLVQELKAELSKRKTLQNKFGSMDAPTTITKFSSQKTDALKIFGLPIAEEGECASSVLTEEQQIEGLELDQLEAELKSELQKLPWSSKEGFGFEGSEDISEVLTVPCGFNLTVAFVSVYSSPFAFRIVINTFIEDHIDSPFFLNIVSSN